MKNMIKVLCVALCLMMALPFAMAEEKPVLKVGTNAEFAPFEYVDDEGNFGGFDMKLMAAICEKLGYEMEIVNMEFDSLIPALESGKIDVSIAAITNRPDRAERVNFTENYFEAYQALIVKADSEYTAVAAGMKVGVQQGTTGDFYASDILGEDSTDVVRYAKALDAVIDLNNGRLDAVVVDVAPAQAYTADYEGLTILDIEDADPDLYAIAIVKGNDELTEAINGALAALIADGTYDALYESEYVGYFGADE